MVEARPPDRGPLVPTETYEIAAQLGAEVTARIILDATDLARRRSGPTVVTPADVVRVYDSRYRSIKSATAFSIALALMGLGAGGLISIFGSADTEANVVSLTVAVVTLLAGTVLLGVSIGERHRA